MSGLELVMKIKAAQPHVATLILTGHRSFDNAVEAIRVGADDFLTKPVDRAHADREDRRARGAERAPHGRLELARRCSPIGAHPDDIEVGRGGTLLGHVAQGHEVSVLVLTGGEVGGVPADHAREAARAAELMGVRLFHVNVGDANVGELEATTNEIRRVVEELDARHALHPQHPRLQPGSPQRARGLGRRGRERAPGLLLPERLEHRRVPAEPFRGSR